MGPAPHQEPRRSVRRGHPLGRSLDGLGHRRGRDQDVAAVTRERRGGRPAERIGAAVRLVEAVAPSDPPEPPLQVSMAVVRAPDDVAHDLERRTDALVRRVLTSEVARPQERQPVGDRGRARGVGVGEGEAVSVGVGVGSGSAPDALEASGPTTRAATSAIAQPVISRRPRRSRGDVASSMLQRYRPGPYRPYRPFVPSEPGPSRPVDSAS